MDNQSLFLEWRQRWNRNLFQFLRRRVRSSVDVQDLAQETYLRLLRARDLNEVRHPLAYLLQVASHVALEWCDRQPSGDSMVVFHEDMLVDGRLPELELDARLSQQRLDETLASLPPMMRAVVLLRLRDERSDQEIAAELRITDRQVRRYLARGYERLRLAIEG
ncbi:MAG TPA: sigma-70 family RNA polymerase sigma factor [Steroidobacteraceae bacterium]